MPSKRTTTQAQRFQALHELAVAAGGVADPRALSKLTADHARALLGVDSAGLYWSDASGLMTVLADNDPEATTGDLRARAGIVGQIMQQGVPVVVEDYQRWDHRVHSVAARGIQSSAGVPILVGERCLGALITRSKSLHHFDSRALQTLALLAAQVGPVIEVARLYAESERRRIEAEALATLAREGANSRDTEQAARMITDRARELLGADYAGIVLLEPDGSRAWWGVSGNRSNLWQVQQALNPFGPVARAMSERQTVVLGGLGEKFAPLLDQLPLHQREGGRCALGTPLISRQGVLGGLLLGWRSNASLAQSQIHLAEALASHAATALESARAHAEELRRADDLARSEGQLRTLYEAVACGVLVLDPSGVITHANSAAEEMLGISLGEMRGRTPSSLWRALADDGTELPLHERPGEVARRTKTQVRRFNLGLINSEGDLRWYQVDSVPVLDRAGNLTQVVSSFIDITEHKRAEEALEHQALHDALTDLPNRTLLYDRLSQAIRAASRDRTPLALMNIDLDRFKEVNDTLGHRVGDILLQHVGQRLREGLRDPDTVARTGGDEFAVLLPGADRAGATLVARKLLHALEQPCLIEDESIPVGGSIGIALHPEHGTDAETLMRRADVAMYEAKRAASGYALYSPEQDQRTNLRRVVVGELRQAIEQSQLALFFQPKLEIKTGLVTGMEALVRWRHPEGILILPERFVPLAEQTGLIEPLTWWVLNTALRQLREWLVGGLDLPITLNISTRTLHDPELPSHISFLARMWHIPEVAITLEITESAVMANPARAAKMLQGLRSMGLHISIDDFGTGYSSLSSLGRLPIEEIKVDRSFVRTMVADPNDAAIVRAAIDLGHQLGLKVVAEGVEDQATARLLEVLGCDEAQGHYFCPPLPPGEVADWLRHRADRAISFRPSAIAYQQDEELAADS